MSDAHELIVDKVIDKKNKDNQEYNKRKLQSCRILTEKIRQIISEPNPSILKSGRCINLSTYEPLNDSVYHYKHEYYYTHIGSFYYTGCDEFKQLAKEINTSDRAILSGDEIYHNVNRLGISSVGQKIRYKIYNSEGDTTNYDTDNKPNDWQ